MARVSRVKKQGLCMEAGEKAYQVALYVRLSVLVGGKGGWGAVKAQELFLRNFIEGKPCFFLYSVYIDNGESGVGFCRPGFDRLMEDVRAGKVNCIIVKDLSRFGRNYIEAGEYLENLFPLLGIRFIAVNDGYDSISPSADFFSMHLKNLINHAYACDISAKVSPVLWNKQERGEFIGSWAPYGYKKSAQDSHKLAIDEKTAPSVRRIFAWRMEKLSYRGIIDKLVQEGIPSPGVYRYQENIVADSRFRGGAWHAETIRRILKNPVYLGHMVQGRKKGALFQGQPSRALLPKEWVVIKNTHPAIIDPFTFEQVQQLGSRNIPLSF